MQSRSYCLQYNMIQHNSNSKYNIPLKVPSKLRFMKNKHSGLGLGNISIYRQYRKTRVCNNGYCRYFHMSIILLMQYIAEYRNISQCSTIRLSTQSKYTSTILKYFSSITHNTHVDDTKYHLNTLKQY